MNYQNESPQVNQDINIKNTNKKWITCGIAGFIILCIGSFLLFGGLGTLLAIFGSEPKNLTVEILSMPTIKTGSEFSVEVRLGNSGKDTIEVTEIQLPKSLMDGSVFINSTPPSTGQMNYGDYTGYKYSLEVPPGESKSITYNFKAIEGDEYSGEIDVLVGTKRKSSNLKIIVSDALSQPSSINPGTSPISEAIPFESVVQIIALVNLDGQIKPGWTGSGSIISPDGLILTNAHVVLSDPYYEVVNLIVSITMSQDAPPEPSYTAKVLQADAALDLAVIKITGDINNNPLTSSPTLPFIKIGNSDTLKLGDPLVILGYPSIGGDTITLTGGEVSGFTSDRTYGNRGFIKTSATIAGGNSGGMATNPLNELIGVPTRVGYGGEGELVDCRALADTNADGEINNMDSCIPTGGFINALRPINLAIPLIEGAKQGEIAIHQGSEGIAQETPSGTLITTDDFSKENGLWYTGGSDYGNVYYQSGELLFNVKIPNYYYWSSFNYQSDLRDSIFSVDTQIQQATGVGDFGLLCRVQDEDNFYALEISEDGYFSIWGLFDGEETFLHEWEYSQEIPIGQPMTVVAGCVGNKLVLGVNDKILAEVTDNRLKDGTLGIIAGTFETPGVTVAFDNFRVYKP